VPQVGHRRVEVQYLENEQVDCRHRPEHPLAPPVPGLLAGRKYRTVGKKWTQIILDPLRMQ